METQYIDIQNVYNYVISLGDDFDFYKQNQSTLPFDEIIFCWKTESGDKTKCLCESIYHADDTQSIIFTFTWAGGEIGSSIIDLDIYGFPVISKTIEDNKPERYIKIKSSESDYLTKDESNGYTYAFTFLVIFAISLMHVKNIKLIDQPITRQQRRRKERKNEPFYKVLVIEPFKTQVRNEAKRTGKTDLQVALHICRGNFATYADDKPLFGKFTGTYFRPAHMRGNAKHGEVIKDYKINPQSNS